MVRVIAINGSPRKKWNTGMLLEKALEGAASRGAETELVHLYDLEYTGCTSCFACKLRDGKSYGKCAVRDDLTPVLEEIQETDALILGSPIYFGTVTGMMRCFMERLLFPYLKYSNPPSSLFGKRIRTAFIYTMNVSEQQMKEYRLHCSHRCKRARPEPHVRACGIAILVRDTPVRGLFEGCLQLCRSGNPAPAAKDRVPGGYGKGVCTRSTFRRRRVMSRLMTPKHRFLHFYPSNLGTLEVPDPGKGLFEIGGDHDLIRARNVFPVNTSQNKSFIVFSVASIVADHTRRGMSKGSDSLLITKYHHENPHHPTHHHRRPSGRPWNGRRTRKYLMRYSGRMHGTSTGTRFPGGKNTRWILSPSGR